MLMTYNGEHLISDSSFISRLQGTICYCNWYRQTYDIGAACKGEKIRAMDFNQNFQNIKRPKVPVKVLLFGPNRTSLGLKIVLYFGSHQKNSEVSSLHKIEFASNWC